MKLSSNLEQYITTIMNYCTLYMYNVQQSQMNVHTVDVGETHILDVARALATIKLAEHGSWYKSLSTIVPVYYSSITYQWINRKYTVKICTEMVVGGIVHCTCMEYSVH